MNKWKALKKLVIPSEPTITKVWFEVTDECNSRCSTCNKWKQEPTKDLLTPEDVYTMFNDPVFKDVDYIVNSGGEPTTRSDLVDVLTAEHRALPKATLQLSTNGLMPHRVISILDRLLFRNADLKMEVGLSLDGIGPEHDSIRGVKGNFKKVDYLIDELNKLRNTYGKDRLAVGFGTVLTDRTINSIPALRSYADEKGVSMLVQWYNESSYYDNRGAGSGRRGYFEGAKQLTLSKTRDFVKEADYPILSDLWCNYLEGKPIKFNCMALRSFCAIKANGDIVPCLSNWDFSIGNVRKRTPNQIFDNAEAGCVYIVDPCQGCLNSWGTWWSFESDPIQLVKYYCKHPIKLVKNLCR